MPYQVTIYSKQEKAAYWADVKAKGKHVGDHAVFTPAKECSGWFDRTWTEPATFSWGFERPKGNRITEAQWIGMLAEAIRTCRRDDGDGRGMTRAEFEELDARGAISTPRTEGHRSGPYTHPAAAERCKKRLTQVRKRLGWTGPGS